MEEIRRINIDWEKTSKNLKLLRNDNLQLRRYVCWSLRVKRGECEGINCENCKFDMDNSISQSELAEIFNVSESMIANWENGRSLPSLEDLLFYCKICGLGLFDIIIAS